MIIGRYHQVNNDTCNGYVQPDREGPSNQLLVLFNLHLQSTVKTQ